MKIPLSIIYIYVIATVSSELFTFYKIWIFLVLMFTGMT